jgi:serine O-acetyltransferase
VPLKTLSSFLNAYVSYDPAARSRVEVLLLYPGVKAIALHRLASALARAGVPFVPRMISEMGRAWTGIEIHPGAKLGRRVIIDHGMGVVIGETAIVGDDVVIYQGVTLGGTSLHRVKRHPTIESKAVLGAGAKVLGNITVGARSRVGANSVVTHDVPADSTVAGIPAQLIHSPIQKREATP